MSAELLLLLTVILLLAAAIGVRLIRSPSGQEAMVPGSDVCILVQGWRRYELQKILTGFADAYDLHPKILRQQNLADGLYRIVVEAGIRPWNVAFLVNYLHYPNEYSHKGRTPAAIAQFRSSEAFTYAAPLAGGTLVTLYVPDNDQAFDQVFASLPDGTSYQLSFHAKRWSPVQQARQSAAVKRLIGIADEMG